MSNACSGALRFLKYSLHRQYLPLTIHSKWPMQMALYCDSHSNMMLRR